MAAVSLINEPCCWLTDQFCACATQRGERSKMSPSLATSIISSWKKRSFIMILIKMWKHIGSVPDCQPGWIIRQTSFSWRFHAGGRLNFTRKARFIGNQCKHWWCHYSVTLCSQHLLPNDTFKEKLVHYQFKEPFTVFPIGSSMVHWIWILHMRMDANGKAIACGQCNTH